MTWPNTRISVMGSAKASKLHSTIKRDQIEQKGEAWSAEAEDEFKQPIRDQYERQGHPYYSSARLWDDGVIDPAQSRQVLGLSLAAALTAPFPPPPRKTARPCRPGDAHPAPIGAAQSPSKQAVYLARPTPSAMVFKHPNTTPPFPMDSLNF